MKLYAYKRTTEAKWMIYIHRNALSRMKGKLDNVALCFSDDRTHVAIFPMGYITEMQSHSTWVAGEYLSPSRLCFIRDGEMLSVCEICKNYVDCVASSFKLCKAAPVSEILKVKGDPVIDLSFLTFVGDQYAGDTSYHSLLDSIDLTEEGISEHRRKFQERARRGAKSRAYRRSVCSKCIMNCKRVREQPDMAITEKLVKRVYDMYIDTLFDENFLERLRWCKLIYLGDGGCNLSDSESHFVDCIFTKTRESYDTKLTIAPFYKDQFIVDHMNHAAIVAASDICRLFRPNKHTTAEVITFKYSYVYAFSLLLRNSPWWAPDNVELPLSKLVTRYAPWPTLGGLYIPGTDISVVDSPKVLTEDEIIVNVKTDAEKLLAQRRATVNTSRCSSPPFCAFIRRLDIIPCHTHRNAHIRKNALDISAALKDIE